MNIEQKIRDNLKLDDSHDIKAHIDETLTFEENLEIIKNEFGFVIDEKKSEQLEKEKYNNQWNAFKNDVDFSIVNDATAVCIIGGRRTGKTALSYLLLTYNNKPVYIFRHPKPKLIESLGFKNLYSLDIRKIRDAIVYCDEPQLVIPKYDKRANEGLLQLLSIAAQNSITLIFSTSDTRWVNKGLEAYIDIWMIKDIETELIKRGSIISKIIRKNTPINPDQFSLTEPEFLFYARKYPQYEGLHQFELPKFWNDELSKPYAIAKRIPTLTANIREKIKEVIK